VKSEWALRGWGLHFQGFLALRCANVGGGRRRRPRLAALSDQFHSGESFSITWRDTNDTIAAPGERDYNQLPPRSSFEC
jgi:hypothetical protein